MRTFCLGYRLIWLCKEGGGAAFGRLPAAMAVCAASVVTGAVAGGVAFTFTTLAAVTAVTVAAAAFARLAWLTAGFVAWLSVCWLSLIARRLGLCVLRQREAIAGRIHPVCAGQLVHWCAFAHQGNGDCVGRGVLAL